MRYRHSPKIRPRSFTPEMREIVVKHYLLEALPAWDVARMLGPEWGQSDIYPLAKKFADELGIDHPNRVRARMKFDWPPESRFVLDSVLSLC